MFIWGDMGHIAFLARTRNVTWLVKISVDPVVQTGWNLSSNSQDSWYFEISPQPHPVVGSGQETFLLPAPHLGSPVG